MILVFCLFKRNRQLLFDSTGDSATERLQKISQDLAQVFYKKKFNRKFGIVMHKVAGSSLARDETSKFPDGTKDKSG